MACGHSQGPGILATKTTGQEGPIMPSAPLLSWRVKQKNQVRAASGEIHRPGPGPQHPAGPYTPRKKVSLAGAVCYS